MTLNYWIEKNNRAIASIFIILNIFLDTLLFYLIIPIIPVYTSKLGASDSIIGLLFSCYAISLLITTPIWGILSDKIGRKIPIVIGLAGFAFSTLFFALASSLPMLFLARILQGISSAANWSPSLALLADYFDVDNRGKIMGLALTAMSVGSLVGAPVGGFLYDFGGYSFPFLIMAVIILIDFTAFLLLVRPPQHVKSEGLHIFKFLNNVNVLTIAAVVLIANCAISLLNPILPIYLTETFKVSSTQIGLIFGAATLAYGIFTPIAGALSDRYNHASIMVSGLVCAAITFPLLVLSQSMWQEVLAFFLVGASIGIALSPTLPAIAKLVDDHEGDFYGIAYAIFDMFFGLGLIIGPLAGGILSDVAGVKLTIIYSGAFLVLCSFALMLSNKFLGRRVI